MPIHNTENARGMFYWAQMKFGAYGRKHRTRYLVFLTQEGDKQRPCIGSIVRTRKGWNAHTTTSQMGDRKYPTKGGPYPTRAAASIALIMDLDRHKFGKDLLDKAGITAYRLPR